MCEHRSHWAAVDDAGLRGGLTTDLIREGLRRQLEQLFEKEQSVTKTIANVGDGSSRGLTPSARTRDVMRFSSDEHDRLRQMSPRVEPSPREACDSARDACRFYSDKPKRKARSLTPDHDVKSRFSSCVGMRSHAAGVASNSPSRWDAPGGLNDLFGRRLHARARPGHPSSGGTSLPGSPRLFDRGCSEERSTATTSKSVKESLRFFLDKQDSAPERVGVRMQPGRASSPEKSPDAAQALTTSKSVKESLRFFLDTQDSAPERVGVRMQQPIKTLLSSEIPASSSAQPTPRGSLRHSKFDTLRKDDTCKASSVASSSRIPSRDPSCSSLPSSRAAKRVVGRSYMPGCQDSNIALRLGTRAASAGKRDLWGRDKFEAGLRS